MRRLHNRIFDWFRYRFKREIEERPDGPCDRYPKGRKMRCDGGSEIETLDELIVRGHLVHIEAMDYDEYAIMVGPGPECIYSMSIQDGEIKLWRRDP